jgi:2-polyprenyl-3-methyl-5-hydroxy-6-metoxy-1,4-benzoquinol methylase
MGKTMASLPVESGRYSFDSRERCPACDASDIVPRYETPFGEGAIGAVIRDYYHIDTDVLAARPYRLDECRACGLVFQAFVGDDRLLSDLYTHWLGGQVDAEHENYRADIVAPRLSRDAHEIMAAASYLGKPLEQLRTLDFGMGWALWSRIGALIGCQSFGTDLAETRMEFARKHGVQTVTAGDVAGLQFDFINADQVFEHVTQPLDLLRRLARSLAPGGVIKLSLPSAENADDLIAILERGEVAGDHSVIMPIHPLEHINSFKKRSIAAMAEAAGLRVVMPSLWHRYAFLRHQGTLNLRRPKKAAKEMVRPVYQHRDPSNLFFWLQRP